MIKLNKYLESDLTQMAKLRDMPLDVLVEQILSYHLSIELIISDEDQEKIKTILRSYTPKTY